MMSLRKLALTSTMTFLVLATLFLPCVKADVQLPQEFVDPVKNSSFEEIGSSVCDCSPWTSNNGGWREVRYDTNEDGTVNVLDIILCCINMGTVPPEPPECDINDDGSVNTLDIILVSTNLGKEMGIHAFCLDGNHSWYTSGGGDYKMWQTLDSNTLNSIKGNDVTFTFWFLPKSVVSDGSENYARAAIFVYVPGIGLWEVTGDWVYPTEKKWHSAFVSAFIPSPAALVMVKIHGKPDFKSWIDLTSLSITETKLVQDGDRKMSLAVNLFRLQEYEGLPNPCRAVLGVAMCANDPDYDVWIGYTQIKVTLISGSFVRITNVTQSNDVNYATDPDQSQEMEDKWLVAGSNAIKALVAVGMWLVPPLGPFHIGNLVLSLSGVGATTLLLPTWRSDADTPYTDDIGGFAKARITYLGGPDFANERCTLELGFNSGSDCQVEITAKVGLFTIGPPPFYLPITLPPLETSILVTVSL